MKHHMISRTALVTAFQTATLIKYESWQKRLLRKHFDLLRNSHSTVLLYADECELLVFGAFLNSPSACQKARNRQNQNDKRAF